MGMNKAESIRILKTTSDQNTIQVALNFPNNGVLLALFENKNLTPQQKQYIVDTADFSNCELTKELSEVLCYSKNSKTRLMVARSYKSMDALIYLYLNDPLDEIKSEASTRIFHSQKLSNAQFRTIISDNAYVHELFVAKHEYCPSDILIELYNKYSENPESEIINTINNRKDCPGEIIEKLLTVKNDNDDILIEQLAKDTCPVSLLYSYMDHKQGTIRAAIASNINCPLDILDKYATDKDIRVVYRVFTALFKNKNVTIDIIEDIIDKICSNNIECINKFFETGAYYYNYSNRNKVAYLLLYKYSNKLCEHAIDELILYSDLTDEQIIKLSENTSSKFICSLLHIACPKTVLLKFASDEDVSVRLGVIKNKNFNEEICRCYINESDGFISETVLEEALSKTFSDDLIYELIIRYIEVYKGRPYVYSKHKNYILHNSYLMSKLTLEQKEAMNLKRED